MKLKSKFTGFLIFSISITLLACNTDKISLSTNNEICSNVANKNFDKIIPIMNSHLQDLERNDENALEKFENWLNSISCVTNATIRCNSCMFSAPPQSAMSAVFTSQGQDIEMTIHILMAEKLQVVRIFKMN